jgi:hypothetical protein
VKSSLGRLVVCCIAASLAALVLPTVAGAAPSVSIVSAPTPMPSMTNFTSVTATATCPAGSTLVGGGDALTRGSAPVTNDGSVTLGVYPSDSAGARSATGAITPMSWTAAAGYSGQAPGLDTVTSYAVCATGVTSATTVQVVSAGMNSLGPVTAPCPAGTSLVGGGGGYTAFPTGVSNNTKLYDSFPSDAAGDLPAAGAANPTAWTVQGNSNSATGAMTAAVALCATDVAVPTVVATATNSPTGGITGGAAVAATVSCPAGTTLLAGGSDIVSNPSGPGTGGQGVHVIGDFPSDAAANPIGSGSAQSWTVIGMDGGQNLSSLSTEALALCAAAPPSPPTVVTGGASNVTPAGADVAGTVNPNGTATSYTFEYGPSTSFGSISPVLSAGSGSSAASVSTSLTGLAATTTYYYRLVATSSAGTTFGPVAAFATAREPQAPVAVTGAASGVTTTTASVAGQVNPEGQPAAFAIEYGPTTSFGSLSTVTELDDAVALEDVTATLSGLSPDTTYYYRVVAGNATGTAVGAVMTFFTGPGGPPIVSTGAATGVTSSGAVLAATVDPHGLPTSFAFEYGPTLSFGSLSAIDSTGAGDGAEGVTLPLSGLVSGTTYRYRIVATNADGTMTGSIGTFTTS